MNTVNNLKKRWAIQRSSRSLIRSQQAMLPYMDQMESDSGMLAMIQISSVAACVNAGTASPAELANTIKQAATSSGIPEETLRACAETFLTIFDTDFAPDQ